MVSFKGCSQSRHLLCVYICLSCDCIYVFVCLFIHVRVRARVSKKSCVEENDAGYLDVLDVLPL